LALVIGGYQQGNYADIVGLCEIENRKVLEDLIKQDSLKKGGYSIIHFDSPDRRGIDVALLYRKKMFKVIYSKAIPVEDIENKNFKTRDILYVKGINNSNDTLHIFVNHWSSRLGGQEESEGKRELCANALRHQIDSLFNRKFDSKIIIMGDLNDEPADESVSKNLKALPLSENIKNKELYNLCYKNFKEGVGSYYYWKEKDWNMIDNMIVSGTLINESNLGKVKLKTQDAQIFKPDWLLRAEKDGTLSPFKTYTGKYTAGYSDHLSIYVLLEYGCK
jgi:predicted extracellular nuclease